MALVSATVCSVKQALSGQVEAGRKVTVRGWVRTIRESKGGLAFVNVTDGSCFDPIQAVVTDQAANYETDVKRLTTGAGRLRIREKRCLLDTDGLRAQGRVSIIL